MNTTDIGNRIKQRRERLGLSLDDIALRIGVNKSTIARYENASIAKPKMPVLDSIAGVLNVSLAWLLGISENSNINTNTTKTKGIRINVLGRIAAGVPIEAVEEIIDWEEITPEMAENGKHFGLQIDGDSMEPKFSKGDVVIVRQQSDVDTGQVAVVMVNGHDATVKRIKKLPNGIMLISTNPNFDPKFYTNEEIETMPVVVLGRVVELRAKF